MAARSPVPWCQRSADGRHHWDGCDGSQCLDCGYSRNDVERARHVVRRIHGPHRHGRYQHGHRSLTRGQWFDHLTAYHGLPAVSR